MRKFRLFVLFCIVWLYFTAGIYGQDAVIQELAGTVEFKQAGAGDWLPARRGQVLRMDTSISTGFRSTAIIVIGSTVLTVRPLTRLTLGELSRSQEAEKVELNLTTGRVRAEVRPAPDSRIDLTVRSSAATASVRGTIFEFDTLNLTVSEGTVEFTGARGPTAVIDAGRSSFASECTGRAVQPEETIVIDLKPPLPVAVESALPSNDRTEPANEFTVDLGVTVSF